MSPVGRTYRIPLPALAAAALVLVMVALALVCWASFEYVVTE